VVYPHDPGKTAAAHLRPGVFTIGEIGYVDATDTSISPIGSAT
jgi:long-chain acyl-CoA synthetase